MRFRPPSRLSSVQALAGGIPEHLGPRNEVAADDIAPLS
jgi:hypothetical protein